MIDIILGVSIVFLILSSLIGLICFAKLKSATDRMTLVDFFTGLLAAVLMTTGLLRSSFLLVEIGGLVILVSFLGTLAIAGLAGNEDKS